MQAAVLETARVCHWRSVYHTYDSRRSQAGFPDLVLLRPPRLIFAELKGNGGKLSAEQKVWIDGLSETALAFQIGEAPKLKPRFEVWVVDPLNLGDFLAVLR